MLSHLTLKLLTCGHTISLEKEFSCVSIYPRHFVAVALMGAQIVGGADSAPSIACDSQTTLTFALLGGVWTGSGQNIEKQNIESQNIERKISKAKYRDRKISKPQNIEVAKYRIAKYRIRKISKSQNIVSQISNGKISNTQNIDGQNIECIISNANYRTQNVEVT